MCDAAVAIAIGGILGAIAAVVVIRWINGNVKISW